MPFLRSLRDLDWIMVGTTLLICLVGVVQIYSATHETPMRDLWWKQLIWVFVGLALVWFMSLVDYHGLLGQVFPLYFMALLGMGATVLLGRTVFGGKRWIPLLFGFHFQVSEFAKLVIVLLVARYLTSVRGDQLNFRDLLRLAGIVGLPFVIVMFLQSDLGTSLTYLAILAGGIMIAGLRWQYWLAIFVVVVLVVPAGWFVLKDYQKNRVLTFLDPNRDPKGAGYQVIQSKIAIGSGGIRGKGVNQGTQTQLRFLPVAHTDFIMAAFAEEHGFAGVVVVLCLYLFLLMQIIHNAQTAPDKAGMYICIGVATLLLFHVLVNVGMVVGRMPVTGIPLPLMSYGGSSLMSMFLMLGLVNNVRLRRFVNS